MTTNPIGKNGPRSPSPPEEEAAHQRRETDDRRDGDREDDGELAQEVAAHPAPRLGPARRPVLSFGPPRRPSPPPTALLPTGDHRSTADRADAGGGDRQASASRYPTPWTV